MDHRTSAFLDMAEASFKVLNKFPKEWNHNKPALRKMAALQADYDLLRIQAKNGSMVITGVTEGKAVTGEDAVTQIIKLTGLTQSFALDISDPELYQKMRVTAGSLDSLSDQKLVLKLKDLHQAMVEVGEPLEEYGVTPARLAKLLATVEKFDKVKADPRLAASSRSTSNATIPEIIKRMRVAFTILDNLIKGMEEVDPTFVQEYLRARNRIGGSGKKGSQPASPKEDQPK